MKSSLIVEKERINMLVHKKDWESKRPYIITVILFVSIVVLAMIYFARH